MLLRRVIEHVRTQNWTAIGIDFVIVVVGVFMGIQLGNWNQARQEQQRGAVYADRLTADLRVEYDYILSLIDYTQDTFDAGNQAYLGLTGQVEMSDAEILINAFRASQYNWYERRRSTFDELVAAGATGLIQDEVLRVAAFSNYSTPLFDIMREEGGAAVYRRLFRQRIEPSVTEALRRECGDRQLDSNDRQMILLTLSYACTIDLDEDILAREVAVLRDKPDLLDALRERNAQRAGRIFDMKITLESSGLNDIFANQGEAP
ncbi:MAG: hypothetical protein AAFR21_16315 [Pseudomonadota bacterium]